MASSSTPRVSWVLLVVLVVALATGAAASILVSASTAPPPSPGPASLVFLPEWAIAAGTLGVAFLVIGSLLYWRLTSGARASMNRAVVTILMVVLLGMLFVIAGRLIGFGGPVSGSGTASSGNTTTSGSNNTTGVIHGNLSGPGGIITLFPGLPGWVPFVAVAAIALIAVAVAVPQARRYLTERRESTARRGSGAEGVPPGVREALHRAAAELDLGGDPRVVILSLYGEMLAYLRPMVGDMEASTPEEIRATHLERLGVRAAAARTLTRLFEEARYSTHPMGRSETARAQEAVRATLDDLGRRTSTEG